jgi:uncharacterized protein YjbK
MTRKLPSIELSLDQTKNSQIQENKKNLDLLSKQLFYVEDKGLHLEDIEIMGSLTSIRNRKTMRETFGHC